MVFFNDVSKDVFVLKWSPILSSYQNKRKYKAVKMYDYLLTKWKLVEYKFKNVIIQTKELVQKYVYY